MMLPTEHFGNLGSKTIAHSDWLKGIGPQGPVDGCSVLVSKERQGALKRKGKSNLRDLKSGVYVSTADWQC
jgi:hypothetical protein